MTKWMATALLWTACNGDKDGETGDTGDTSPPVTNSTGVERIATILALEGDATAGAVTYTNVCAFCHKPDGSGDAYNPALAERVPQMTDEQILTAVLEGGGNMDAYRFMKNQDLADLLAHLRASFP